MNSDRPTVFIGSSSEGLEVAEAVRDQLKARADVDLWNEKVFKLNQSSLDSLLDAASLYDFAILVLTPDDVLRSRKKQYLTARDNVVFEHGLFLGRLGPRRAFVLCEESVKVFTDFAGITVTRFRRKRGQDINEAVEPACKQLRAAIRKNYKYAELGMLPSTALAIGYFENFIAKVFSSLLQGNYKLKIDKKVRDDLRFAAFVFKIVIPEELSYVEKGNLELTVKVKDLQQILVETPYRDFPFYVRAQFDNTRTLTLYDFPTTLLSSKKAIQMSLRKGFVGKSLDEARLERREIRNFRIALEYLLNENYKDAFGKNIMFVGPDLFDAFKEERA